MQGTLAARLDKLALEAAEWKSQADAATAGVKCLADQMAQLEAAAAQTRKQLAAAEQQADARIKNQEAELHLLQETLLELGTAVHASESRATPLLCAFYWSAPRGRLWAPKAVFEKTCLYFSEEGALDSIVAPKDVNVEGLEFYRWASQRLESFLFCQCIVGKSTKWANLDVFLGCRCQDIELHSSDGGLGGAQFADRGRWGAGKPTWRVTCTIIISLASSSAQSWAEKHP